MGDVNHSPIPFRVDLRKSYLTMITMETEDIQDIILKNMFLSGFDIILGGKSFTLVVPSAVANVNVVCFKSGVSEILLEKAFKLLRRSSFTFLFFFFNSLLFAILVFLQVLRRRPGDQKNTSALLDLQLATEPCPFIDKSTNE